MLNWTLGTVNFILWCYKALVEIKQLKNDKHWQNYFLSFWNWVDMTGLLMTLFVIVCGVNEPDVMVSKESLRVVAAFASLRLLTKTFDWLRLFEETAFYI